MRALLLVALLIISFVARTEQIDQVEILKDPTFDQGLASWSKSKSGVKILRECDNKQKACVLIQNKKNGDYSYIAQKVNVSYGDVINIEFDMKGVGADVGQNGGEFYIKAYNSSGDIFDTYSHQEKTGNFDWKKINFQYAIPHEAKQLTIGFSAGRENIGSVIFDNLRVRKYTIGEKIVSSDNLNRKSELSKGLISNNNFFDLDGYLIKDGKRFFPLGVFVTNSSTDDFKKISDAGFNTILSYSIPAASNVDDFFLQAKNNNLSVIFSLKDMYKGMKWAPSFSSDPEKLVSYIDLIKVQDNLLAWYINDELPVTRISEVKNLYSIVRSRDESHPILQVVYRTAIARFFLEYTDIIAADVYPVGVRKDLSVTYDMAKDLDDIVRNNRKIKTSWFIPQIMDWGVYRKDFLSYPPSYEEMKNQAYQALIAGSKGLIFYSYYDLYYSSFPRKNKSNKIFFSRWNDVIKMSQGIKKVLPSIMSGHEYKKFKVPNNAEIKLAMYSDKNIITVLMANPYYMQKIIDIKFYEHIDFSDLFYKDLKMTARGNKLSIIVPPLYSGSFSLKIK